MWDWIVNFLYTVLAGLQSFSGDWGMAVILLTIIIRIILVPMTNKQTASMARMSVVQPKLKEIQERYADDPVRQNEEMRKLYAEINFNPLGGCLPLLLQSPIFMEKEKLKAEAQMANKPIEVDVVRKEKKPRPHKKA